MAPDRGGEHDDTMDHHNHGHGHSPSSPPPQAEPSANTDPEPDFDSGLPPATTATKTTTTKYLPKGRHFTARGVAAGLAVGLVICFSNMYFGLQTGWVSMMTMPASLLGFGIFRALSPHLSFPFSPVENVLVQSVAGGMAIMPLGCGFVGVMPAMEYLLKPSEQGPLHLSMWKLIIWSLGLCYFGVVFAVPLRRQVIIREQLRFPSGFSTAVLIGILHGKGQTKSSGALDSSKAATFGSLALENQPLIEPQDTGDEDGQTNAVDGPSRMEVAEKYNWGSNIRLLLITFGVSGFYTLCTYFFPALRNLPIFGRVAANTWLWTLNPSFAYVGQGIVMGPSTTIHMLIGAIIGWGILSPLAKYRGWAPGPIDDWETGSKGWIVWTSLAIMLADSVISLGLIAFRPLFEHGPALYIATRQKYQRGGWKALFQRQPRGYTALQADEGDLGPSNMSRNSTSAMTDTDSLPSPTLERRDPFETYPHQRKAWDHDDAPPDQLVGSRTVSVGLVLSVLFCIASIHITFGNLVPLYATVIAVLMAMVLSIMGVRALGETDLNPVSGISKLAQLFFALIIPQSNKSSVLINLVAGAVSEAGALQAGDLMQDLKTGHLLGAAPRAQFWGQIIGATVGAIVSAFIYRLYTAVYEVPGDLFQVPTAFVWIFTARLVTGKGLPHMAREFAAGAAVIFAVLTTVRARGIGSKWHAYIPGGIAVAVGMYNVPSFTLARTMGGLVSWYWRVYLGKEDTPLIVLASGFILGEGFLSIVNLILQSAQVPHL
ncbi:OPT superfamily oligopeptide transporter [Biscogniauxia sp. FL1348]|nr:OPT superfamily oligopeptide transporter [Biscogniauxia sp. FL1348]